MILNHLWGLYAHPHEEWHDIDNRHEKLFYSMSHILLVALIPCITAYYSTVHIGWQVGFSDTLTLTSSSALFMAGAMYLAMITGVLILAYLAFWMAKTFGAEPTYTQTVELAAYTSTPMFMSGIAALYPELWFIACVGIVGLCYSVYLLYVGTPIIMHIPEDRGFIYASSVVTGGLVLLVCILAATAALWTSGFGPLMTH